MNMMLEAWLAGHLKDAIEDKTIKIFFSCKGICHSMNNLRQYWPPIVIVYVKKSNSYSALFSKRKDYITGLNYAR